MAKKLPEVDVLLVGLGWTGGILAKELSAAGVKVLALERGAMRTPQQEFTVPQIRDELRYSSRNDMTRCTLPISGCGGGKRRVLKR